MGIEYNIRYQPPDRAAWDAFVARLDNPRLPGGWHAFTVELSEQGVYFCDNCGPREPVAVALYRILNEAMLDGKPVVIEEL